MANQARAAAAKTSTRRDARAVPDSQASKTPTREWLAWNAQAEKMRATIHRIAHTPSIAGKKWKDGQVAYLEKRLAEWVEDEPPKYL